MVPNLNFVPDEKQARARLVISEHLGDSFGIATGGDLQESRLVERLELIYRVGEERESVYNFMISKIVK